MDRYHQHCHSCIHRPAVVVKWKAIDETPIQYMPCMGAAKFCTILFHSSSFINTQAAGTVRYAVFTQCRSYRYLLPVLRTLPQHIMTL